MYIYFFYYTAMPREVTPKLICDTLWHMRVINYCNFDFDLLDGKARVDYNKQHHERSVV